MDRRERHFVLVHGAKHGSWCWYKVATLLRSVGHKVTSLDMAASGINPKQHNEVTSFSEYIEPLTQFMKALPSDERVILVGHSAGGGCISVAMENFSENVSVAVFAAGLMPGPNLTFAALNKEFLRRFGTSSSSEGSEKKIPTVEELAWHDRWGHSLNQLSPPEHYYLEEDIKEGKVRMRNLYRKPTNLYCNAGSRCSIFSVLWSLLGCLILLNLYSNVHHKDGEVEEVQLRVSHHPQFCELQKVELENIQIPSSKGKRSPRAAKRRPKRTTTLMDEFMDVNSSLRHVFYPGKKTAVDPMKPAGNDSYYYRPGRIWLDTDGNPIQAHGGGILYDEKSRIYYWYGEYKDGPTYHAHKKGAARVDIIGVGCYSSKDLWTWKYEGIVLVAEETNETHDLYKSNVLERPKVIFNDKTGKYVMWMHVDDVNYTKASVGVAISDTPDGPFDYLGSQRPHGYQSRDMTVFKDDDGVAYLIYSSEDNSELHIGPLTEDYLNVTSVMRRILVGQRREAPALFKHQGTYYMITSGCTGWAPNEALAHAAESILGPWETMGNPCIGGNKMFRLTTFFAQSTFVLPVPRFPGSFIFMADRWNPADLRDSRYVWLPLIVAGPLDQPLEYSFQFPFWSRVSIYWHRKWRLPQGWSRSM